MKLYKNIPARRARTWFNRKGIETMKWGMSLKPGDIVNACGSLWNRPIQSTKIIRINPWNRYNPFCSNTIKAEKERENKICKGHHRKDGSWIILEIDVFFADGGCCTIPGGGCVEEPYSVDKLHRYVLEYAESEYVQQTISEERNRELQEWVMKIKAGIPVCDERGVLLSYGQNQTIT